AAGGVGAAGPGAEAGAVVAGGHVAGRHRADQWGRGRVGHDGRVSSSVGEWEGPAWSRVLAGDCGHAGFRNPGQSAAVTRARASGSSARTSPRAWTVRAALSGWRTTNRTRTSQKAATVQRRIIRCP